MVQNQLIPRGITDQNVLNVMTKVPRHEFVPENMASVAYEDSALPIEGGQTISQPFMVAVMTQLLNLDKGKKVLEVGTGSGYQAAVLAEIAGHVYTIETIASLSHKAQDVINKLGYKNVEFIVGDGTQGYAQAAPYDAIIVTAAAPSIPSALTEQLSEGGTLVVPVGNRWKQTLNIVKKSGDKLTVEEKIDCVFVPLLGKYGWKSE